MYVSESKERAWMGTRALGQRTVAMALGLGMLGLGAWGLSGCSSDDNGQSFGGPGNGQNGVGNGIGVDNGNGGVGGPGNGGGGTGGPPDTTVPIQGEPFIQDDTDLSGLDQGTIDQLKDGGSQELNIIYPYEGTVFPGGILPPIIQWPEGASAAYVRMQYDSYDQVDYEFAVGNTDPGRLEIPHAAWEAITDRSPNTPLSVTVSAMIGGSVRTKTTRWRIAQGRLQGSIFYNTYDSPGLEGGAILRLNLGQPEADVFLSYQGLANPVSGPCYGCHSVSANGETMAATYHNYLPAEFEAFTYNLGENPELQPPRQSGDVPEGTFGALTPDGSKYLTIGNPQCTAGADTYPRAPENFPLVEGPAVAVLRDATTGQALNANGLDPNRFMWMPQFSPDGTKVVFNDAHPGPNGRTNRRTLAVMDFDDATNTFSNHRVIYEDDGPAPSIQYHGYSWPAGSPFAVPGTCTPPTHDPVYYDTCSGPCYPGWPFFTPDGKKVIFVRGSEPDFVSAAPGGRDNRAISELWMVDVDNPSLVRRLDNANGDGHLPQAQQRYEYFPTVMPVSAGGYYWLFWTSRRGYGNIQDPPTGDGLAGQTGHEKKIWVSAIRINTDGDEFADPNPDLSHPGFYLRGQSNSGNVRAFSALDPCVAVGQSCRTGIDCCTGFCDWDPESQTGQCIIERECSQRYEACSSNEDCCPPEDENPTPTSSVPLTCVGGFCERVELF